MKICKWVTMVVIGCAPSFGQGITIAGTAYDKETKTPLQGVAITLQASKLSGTTDASGAFKLEGSTGIGRPAQQTPSPSLAEDGRIALTLTEQSIVTLQTFSTQGRLLASTQEHMDAGAYLLKAPVEGPGIYFHRLQIGTHSPTILRQSTFASLGVKDQTSTNSAGRALAAEFQDTLVATLAGYTTTKVVINSATATNLEVLLSKINTTPGSITKARVIVTTDLQADPDDDQSLVHMFVNANDLDIEGLVVATSCWKKTQSSTSYMDKFTAAYEQAYANLKVHASDFPTPAYLKSIVKQGQKGYSMGDVGVGKDSPGSDLIIAAVDKNDPRPVWVNSWGGSNTVAQAITKVKASRSQAELDKFISKLRVYDILGQDEAGAWLAKNFPNLFYIRATAVYGWQYSDSWVDANVQNKGALGKVYPDRAWAIEGDSPAFLHLLANGLSDPNRIDQGGWGGRFDLAKKQNIKSMSAVTGEGSYQPYYMYGNTSEGTGAIKKWSDGYTNNFAARMIWSVTGTYSGANHHPIAIVNGDKTRDVLYITAKAGSDVVLDGAGSSDPDKNNMSWSWSLYAEPSSEKTASISGGNTSRATVKAPSSGKTLHIILTLKDNGSPALTSYRRVVVTGS